MNALIARIYTHIEEEGECWNWTGAMQTCGASPVMRWQGKTNSVRRLIMLDKTRSRIQKNWLASYKCGNPLCVRPEHLVWTVRSVVQRRTTDEQQHQFDVLRCKKLSDKARAKGKLTLELATEIRMAEGNQRHIAAQYGVSQATVSAIKIGKTWRNYSSPFAGLGAR